MPIPVPLNKYREPWFLQCEPDHQARIKRQDLDRRDAERAIEQENSLAPQSPMREAFVALAVRQCIENLSRFSQRNKAVFADDQALPVATLDQRHLTLDEANAALQRLEESLGAKR